MKSITKIAAAAAIAFAAAGAQAQLYGEVGYSAINVDMPGHGVDLGAISGIVGYGVHENLAFEGFLALGVNDDKIGSTKVELEHAYGIFAKPRVMLNPNFELYGRLGYVESKAKGSNSLGSLSDSDGDWAYGIGGNYYFNPNTYLGVSYTRLYDKHDVQADGLTVGVGMKF